MNVALNFDDGGDDHHVDGGHDVGIAEREEDGDDTDGDEYEADAQ